MSSKLSSVNAAEPKFECFKEKDWFLVLNDGCPRNTDSSPFSDYIPSPQPNSGSDGKLSQGEMQLQVLRANGVHMDTICCEKHPEVDVCKKITSSSAFCTRDGTCVSGYQPSLSTIDGMCRSVHASHEEKEEEKTKETHMSKFTTLLIS